MIEECSKQYVQLPNIISSEIMRGSPLHQDYFTLTRIRATASGWALLLLTKHFRGRYLASSKLIRYIKLFDRQKNNDKKILLRL